MSAEKQRSRSIIKMEERAVQETRVKDLINKYNTRPKKKTPQLRRVGGRKVRRGSSRRGSAMLTVPTNVSEVDPEVGNSKSAAETEILKKLEEQQRQFQALLEEQKAEKEALAARLEAAEHNLEHAASVSEEQARRAMEERERLERLRDAQKAEHAREVQQQKAEEKDIEKSYDTTVKVRRASAAAVGKALLTGALVGAATVDVPVQPTVAAVAAPALPSRPKPPEPESDSEESSSVSSSSGDEDDDAPPLRGGSGGGGGGGGGGSAAAGAGAGAAAAASTTAAAAAHEEDDGPADAYEENIEEILAKPIEKCTHIEKAARKSAMSEAPIPPLVALIPDFNDDPAGLYEFLHAPVPYEQGIVQCELHRKGKCFYLYLTASEENDTKFLMFAQDRSGFGALNLMVTMVANGKRNDPSFLGKVRGNVLNTKYVIFDNGEHPHHENHQKGVARKELGFVNYTLYQDAPRKMTVVAPKVRDDGTVPEFRQTRHDQDILERKLHENDDKDVSFSENKKPKWDRKRQCFVLDFKKRATEASVKNFLLVTDEDPEHDSVLFGKRGKDEFNLDVQYPMSFFQAFTIALTAIYSKSAPTFS